MYGIVLDVMIFFKGCILVRFFQIVICLATLNFCGLAAVAQMQYQIDGRIIDFSRKPVANAQVKLLDRDGIVIDAVTADDTGSFMIKHRKYSVCSLEIVPNPHSGLASALVKPVPGDINRTFLVTLHKGFHLSGKITHNGRGLKSLEVEVTSSDCDREGRSIHAGGTAITGHNGTFNMTVVPGIKKLTVYNHKYPNLMNKFEKELTLSADQQLPDIDLPLSAVPMR